ncbi:hypothetical protein HJFPF1_04482 [Paramyrothecium foliicola]|nr:hypothetical protein HJFPF1_04482 [Paramyrothecium foliicola]
MSTTLILFYLEQTELWYCYAPGLSYTFLNGEAMTSFASAMTSGSPDAITTAFFNGQIFQENMTEEEAGEALDTFFGAADLHFDAEVLFESAFGETLLDNLVAAGEALLALLTMSATERRAAVKSKKSTKGRATLRNATREFVKLSPQTGKKVQSGAPDYQVKWFNQCAGPNLDQTFTFGDCVQYPSSTLPPGQATSLAFNWWAVTDDTYQFTNDRPNDVQGWITPSSGGFAAFQLTVPGSGNPYWKYCTGAAVFDVNWDSLAVQTALDVTDQPAGCTFAVQYVATTTTPLFGDDTLSIAITFKPPT